MSLYSCLRSVYTRLVILRSMYPPRLRNKCTLLYASVHVMLFITDKCCCTLRLFTPARKWLEIWRYTPGKEMAAHFGLSGSLMLRKGRYAACYELVVQYTQV